MSYAASQYQQQSGSYLSGREIEVMAFTHVNTLLKTQKTPTARLEALSANQKLWSVSLSSLNRVDCPLDDILKQDLITVGTWSMRYSNIALNRDLPLAPLMDINQDMIDGLKPAKQAAPMPPYSTQLPTSGSSDNAHRPLQLMG